MEERWVTRQNVFTNQLSAFFDVDAVASGAAARICSDGQDAWSDAGNAFMSIAATTIGSRISFISASFHWFFRLTR